MNILDVVNKYLINPIFIYVILTIIIVVSFLILPISLITKRKIVSENLQPAENAFIDDSQNSISDIKIINGVVSFKRANEKVKRVVIEIAATFIDQKKQCGEIYNIDFSDDEPISIELPGQVKEIALSITKVNNAKTNNNHVLKKENSSIFLISLLQGVSCSLGIILFSYSNSGFIFYNPEYAACYVYSLVGLAVFIISFIVNKLIRSSLQKGGK